MDDGRQCGENTKQARTTKWVLITGQHFMYSPKWKQKAGHHALVIGAIGHIINKCRVVFKVKHSSPNMVWDVSATSSKAELYPLKSKQNSSHQMGALQTETTSILQKKIFCDWKPGKLMSLHFNLFNLYRLLCQGL